MKCRSMIDGGNPMLELPQPEDDGLVIPEVGEWSSHKHHFLLRYIDAFTTAMHGKNWSELYYIDLFAGAGLERLDKSRQLAWGSPLLAAHAQHMFASLILCEKDRWKCRALEARLQRPSVCVPYKLVCGDANEQVREIVKLIAPGSLSVAFLDPYGLHLWYETVQALSQRRMDLIIFFPDRLDAVRNFRAYYWDNPQSNLDRVLGTDIDWRSAVEEASSDKVAEILHSLYVSQLSKLGYEFCASERIPSSGSPLYWLIFASKAKIGQSIWHRVTRKKPDGQREFDFNGS